MTIGEKIARARRANGWTQEELAERLGVTRQSVSKWESDAALPETEKIVRLCELLHMSCDRLLREDAEAAQPSAAGGAAAAFVCGRDGEAPPEAGADGTVRAGAEAPAPCARDEDSAGLAGGENAKAARRHLSGGELAFVLFCLIVGGLLVLFSAALFFALPDRLDDIGGELALFFGIGCALVLFGVVVGLFLRRR